VLDPRNPQSHAGSLGGNFELEAAAAAFDNAPRHPLRERPTGQQRAGAGGQLRDPASGLLVVEKLTLEALGREEILHLVTERKDKIARHWHSGAIPS